MKIAFPALLVISACAAHAQAQTQPDAASTAPPAVKSIDVKKGDQWTYEYRDELTGEIKYTVSYVVSDLTDDEIDVRFKSKATSSNAEITVLETYDRWWRKTEAPKYTFKKSLESTGIPDNLTVGKEWSYDYEAHSVDSPVNFKWAGHGEVVAWEKVTLPSGKAFDAYKIEYHEATTHAASNQIQIVSAATPGERKSETTIVEWYAPSVNRFVKRSYESRQNGKMMDSGSEVLTAYSRREGE
jgi:hypothetical protein